MHWSWNKKERKHWSSNKKKESSFSPHCKKYQNAENIGTTAAPNRGAQSRETTQNDDKCHREKRADWCDRECSQAIPICGSMLHVSLLLLIIHPSLHAHCVHVCVSVCVCVCVCVCDYVYHECLHAHACFFCAPKTKYSLICACMYLFKEIPSMRLVCMHASIHFLRVCMHAATYTHPRLCKCMFMCYICAEISQYRCSSCNVKEHRHIHLHTHTHTHNIYIYIYIYNQRCVYVCVPEYIYMQTYTHIHTQEALFNSLETKIDSIQFRTSFMGTYICMYMHACACMGIYVYIYILCTLYVCIYVCVYIYIYIYTCTTYSHALPCVSICMWHVTYIHVLPFVFVGTDDYSGL